MPLDLLGFRLYRGNDPDGRNRNHRSRRYPGCLSPEAHKRLNFVSILEVLVPIDEYHFTAFVYRSYRRIHNS